MTVATGSTGDAPWTTHDLSALVVRLGLGIAVATVAWAGAAGSVDVGTQVRWADVSVAGVIIAGVGEAVFLVAGMRRVRARQDALVDRALPVRPTLAIDTVEPDVALAMATPLMTKYHRPTCPLVTGKPVSGASVDEQRSAGRAPCRVCEP